MQNGREFSTRGKCIALIIVAVILVVMIVAAVASAASYEDDTSSEASPAQSSSVEEHEGALEEPQSASEDDGLLAEPTTDEEDAASPVDATHSVEHAASAAEEASSVEEEPAVEDESASEADPVTAAYDEILDEFRAFADDVASGRSGNLEVNPATNTWVDYPWVTALYSASNLTGDDPAHFEYAYTDLDGNGVPELLIGNSFTNLMTGADGVTLLQMFSYYDGQPHELFQSFSGNRNQFAYGQPDYYDITANGYIRSQGGEDPSRMTFTFYGIDDGRLYTIESIDLDLDAGVYVRTTEQGDEEEIDESEFNETLERYPWGSTDTEGFVDSSSLADWHDL